MAMNPSSAWVATHSMGSSTPQPNMAQTTGANIQNSVPPAAQATPVGAYTAAAGSVINTIGGLFKGSPEQNGALPFEIEKQMILDSQSNLSRIQESLKRSQAVYKSFAEQYNILKKVQMQAVPSAADMKALNNTNIAIAKAFGNNTLEAIKSGYLDEDTARLSGLIEDRAGQLHDNLSEIMKWDYKDPALEQKLSNGRRQLEQSILRGGGSAEDVARGLAQFDQQAEQSRFSRVEELRNSKMDQLIGSFNATTQGLTTAFDTKQTGMNQNLNRAVTGYQQVQNAIQNGQNAISNLATLNNNYLSGTNDYFAGQTNLMNTQQNIYSNIANTPLSLKTRGALGDDVSFSHGFLGMDTTNPAADPASIKFRKQYQSAKAKRFATIT